MRTPTLAFPFRIWDYHRPLGMTVAGAAISVLMVLPLAFIASYGLRASLADWVALWSNWLPELLANTLKLGFATALFTLVLGTSLAWLVTRYDFPGRRVWSWLLATPLGIPPYIMAFVYTEMFLPGGWAQVLAAPFLGPGERLPMLYGSFPGVVLVLGMATYPYVYLLVRASLINHNATFEEIGQTQGVAAWRRFLGITLPLHRPAIMAGMFLVVMYVFADFGAVSMMRYSTFTRAIYLELTGRADRVSASMLCLVLILISAALFWLERRSRSRSRFYQTSASFRPLKPLPCGPGKTVLIWAFLLAVFSASFGIVIAFLLERSWERLAEGGVPPELWAFSLNSLLVSGAAATTAIFLIVPIAYLATRYRDRLYQVYLRCAYAGYVLPGPIVGVGVLFIAVHLFQPIYGTVATVVLAYLIRFLPQGLQAQEAAFLQIKPHLEEAARSLGSTFHTALLRVVFPLIKPGLFTGWVLIFVSSMKELPATLLLRPLGFDTLAVRIWIETSEEFYILAAPAALVLIAVTFPLFAILLSRTFREPIG
ncbi:MAG: iron ABC transporter permease [SAR324 cluster bacterium]|nr:iron ABC transporter permease [SAR324 cluster bacterium]